jgi:RNase P subunit RPR2
MSKKVTEEDLFCPKCQSDNLTIQSSSSLELTQIFCDDCDYIEDFPYPEDKTIKKFYKHYIKGKKNNG